MWPTRGLALSYWPVALLSITALQIVVFATTRPEDLGWHMTDPIPVRALTSVLAHLDGPHLAVNLVSQLALGFFVECLHGHLALVLVYFASGVGGALWYRGWWCRFYAPRRIYLVGCSGAVYGLMASYASHLLVNWAEVRFKAWWAAAVALTLLLDVGLYVADGPEPGVAYAAHVGGGAFGLCAGVLFLRNVRVLRCERGLQVGAAVGMVGMAGLALLACA